MKELLRFSDFGFLLILSFCIPNFCGAQNQQKPLWQNQQFSIFANSVVQNGGFMAQFLSSTEISSNYKSPANAFQKAQITFKFSINGKDNEMKSGVDHHFICLPNQLKYETALIKFGTQWNDPTQIPENTYLNPGSILKFRLDMREVLNDFKTKGYYLTFKGEKIFKEDFKGVFVAGSTSPLTWDFDNLGIRSAMQLKDDDGDGIYELSLKMGEVKEEKQIASQWKMSRNVSAFPQYSSPFFISNAVYNLALEEMEKAIEPDSTFRTGKEWAGVWTRDISYSIILSMAYLQPKVAINSLMKKVKNKRIIQDTGTGGAYPVSTDRMVWATAAWEIFKVTGDKNWLQQAYEIISNSVGDDMHNAYDPETGMVKGESSFLDWREQTYPKWMQPADIFESECLGTNAVHFKANMVLAEMADLLGDKTASLKYKSAADRIKAGINKYLWIADKGYFGQFLYGRKFKITSPKSEALGEALSVIFDIADSVRQPKVVQNTPVTDFGISCIFPQIPGIEPYHNNAVWPFVESYWALAAAKVGNEASLMKSISAIYRPAALFLTNKENFVASNGDYAGTVINSSNMLWSLSGSLALVHKIIFGIEFKTNGLAFHPFVPKAFGGKRSLKNFKYRNTILNIDIEGFGNKIKAFEIDGKPSKPFVDANLKGTHSIKIKLANNQASETKINSVENHFAPATPVIDIKDNMIIWQAVKDAVSYSVLQDGIEIGKTKEPKWTIKNSMTAEYQVIVVDILGWQSFASEPLAVEISGSNTEWKFELESIIPKSLLTYKGFSGDGFVEIRKTRNRTIEIPVVLDNDGLFSIDFKYANGNGPVNTENKCAIRTLSVDNKIVGSVVFPQRGTNEWSNWGFTNALMVNLKHGAHTIKLTFEQSNENMNGEINEAMIDYMQVIFSK